MVAWSAAKLSSCERLSFITLISDEVKASRAMQELLRDVAYWHLADIKKLAGNVLCVPKTSFALIGRCESLSGLMFGLLLTAHGQLGINLACAF